MNVRAVITPTSNERTCYQGHPVGPGDLFCGQCGAQIEQTPRAGGLHLQAHGLKVARSGRTILNDVSLVIPEHSLVAVLGPSGSGKSTLLGALCGSHPADTGNVTYAGHDLYEETSAARELVGVVPQKDLIHDSLTVAAALDYGARLRFSPETTKDQRTRRIDNILSLLSLTKVRNSRIDRLSGGERKRTSMALELLTAPSLLFLDEPTSGLDPGLDGRVMKLMRELAKDEAADRTVIVVTHSVANLHLCDLVVILAPGGELAFFGSPADAPTAFGVSDYPEIFDQLDSNRDLVTNLVAETRTDQLAQIGQHSESPNPQPLAEVHRLSALGQWLVFVRRQIAVMAGDRRFLLMLVGLPLVLGLLSAAIGTSDGLGPGPDGSNPYARSILLVMLISVVLLGIANTIQQISSETAIYSRERAVGLSRGAYLAAKIVVLTIITLLQTSVVVALGLMDRPGPANPPVAGSYGAIVIPLLALAIASVVIGLTLSAFLKSTERTLNALVATVVVLLVFSGAFVLRFDTLALDILQAAVPSSWTYDALAAATDIQTLFPSPNPKAQWEPTEGNWITGVVGTSFFWLIGGVTAWFAVGGMDPKRRNR